MRYIALLIITSAFVLMPTAAFAQTNGDQPKTEQTKKVEKSTKPEKVEEQTDKNAKPKSADMFKRAQDQLKDGKVCGEKPKPVA